MCTPVWPHRQKRKEFFKVKITWFAVGVVHRFTAVVTGIYFIVHLFRMSCDIFEAALKYKILYKCAQ